jgi:hypothetical protein
MATQPQRHASIKDPSTWSDYGTALAAVQAGHADGISYVLTKADPFAAVDLDHCRDQSTHSIDIWAQNFLDVGRHSYSEVTPSGTGCRIWGLANGDSLQRKFTLEISGRQIAAELFRRTNKALTITGYKLNTIRELTNVDRLIEWAVVWGERRKAAASEQAAPAAATDFNGGHGSGYSVNQIEEIVRIGAPAGANRSDVFHTVVGHYVGCGWGVEQIFAHLQQHPEGIGGRYLAEDRLHGEIARSASNTVVHCRCLKAPAGPATAGTQRRRSSRSPSSRRSRRNRNRNRTKPIRSPTRTKISRIWTKSRRSRIQTCHRYTPTAIRTRGRSRHG